uniref:Uncharacterized protein n=1 Tax=Ascaris lumbricoides TaxID=6252 RepID=A0A9J2PB38_ASCLU
MLLDRFIRLLVVRFTYAALPFTDHILFIETSYDQAVLTTTKDGPVENLHIRIDVTDLFTGRETPIFDLSGPLLMLSRGRYTINFLRANRWYGIMFRSENLIDGVTHMNIEEKLIRTLPTTSSRLDIGVQVSARREGTENHRLEDLLLMAEWTDPLTRQNLSEAIIRVRMYCDDSFIESNFILDNTQMNTTKLLELEDGDLTIFTRYGYDKRNRKPETATIRITAFELADTNRSVINTNSLTVEYSTANHTDEYVLHNLLPNMWYAVHYEYMRTSPFHIYDEQRFIVESPDENGTSAEHPPAYLQFSPNSFYSPSGKIDHSLLPSVQIVRDSYYKGKRMLIIVEAPCDNDDNDTEIWLSDAQPTTRLHVDLEEVICVHGPRPFCDQYYMHNEAMPHCETSICYTTQVLIDNEFYEAEQVCEDVIEHYPSSSHFCSYLNFLQLMLAFYGAARFIS